MTDRQQDTQTGPLLLGIDLGSSSVKVALVDVQGMTLAQGQSPQDQEMTIDVPRPGFAEQPPDRWWDHLTEALSQIDPALLARVAGIGIGYQMHGLVLVDQDGRPLRPAIIWCDGRAVDTGAQSTTLYGKDRALEVLRNELGNFTVSKLAWVAANEPDLYAQARAALLPGDYIALKLTGEALTTPAGLSEGIALDFDRGDLADGLLESLGLRSELIPRRVPVFSDQGTLLPSMADKLGLPRSARVTYRAGDQPNNALALGCLDAGQVAANAGTSAVLYALANEAKADSAGRVNVFAHVNHAAKEDGAGTGPRYGILACLNGSGIAYSWLRRMLSTGGALMSYSDLNALANGVPAGAAGLRHYPYGNGPERLLGNLGLGATYAGLDFNVHTAGHLVRACQEGIAFALADATDIMRAMGARLEGLRAGRANLFFSEVFARTLCEATGLPITYYQADGANGAARGAGVALGLVTLEALAEGPAALETLTPGHPDREAILAAYKSWQDKRPLPPDAGDAN